jgi:nicotinate phosphoribosyltransferase
MAGDTISLADDRQEGEPLLAEVMRAGKRTEPPPALAAIREHAARELARLPEPLRRLDPGRAYEVAVGEALRALAESFDRNLKQDRGA